MMVAVVAVVTVVAALVLLMIMMIIKRVGRVIQWHPTCVRRAIWFACGMPTATECPTDDRCVYLLILHKTQTEYYAHIKRICGLHLAC